MILCTYRGEYYSFREDAGPAVFLLRIAVARDLKASVLDLLTLESKHGIGWLSVAVESPTKLMVGADRESQGLCLSPRESKTQLEFMHTDVPITLRRYCLFFLVTSLKGCDVL